MKYVQHFMWLFILSTLVFFSSCSKEVAEGEISESESTIPDTVLEKIKSQGYSTENVQLFMGEDGENSYVVEGDVLLTAGHLEMEKGESVIIAEEEHYRMTDVPIFGTPSRREGITVGMDRNLPAIYWDALQNAATRYNRVGGLRFYIRPQLEVDRNTCNPCPRYNPDIEIIPFNGPFLGLADPPYERTIGRRGGGQITSIEPGRRIRVWPAGIGNEPEDHIATIIAHEIGHTIGFRHTDWFNRSISCGAGGAEPDPDNLGALHIPGTPTGNSPGSWMLACIDDGVIRPFTGNDRIALRHVHGR